MTYRAALIGCGKIGSEFADDPRVAGIYSHAGAYSVCPDTVLVSVCDADEVRSEQCAKRWGVRASYLDPLEMLVEQRPDIVSVCTPDNTHYELVRAAICTDGVHAVLAEKPLATTVEQARELVRLADERGIVLAVNYSRRYDPQHAIVREFLRTGGIGTIQTVGGYYTKGTLHNGTHWFDLARFLIGEVNRVWGFDTRQEHGTDPTLDAFLEFACGASAHLHGCDATAFSIFEMDMIGTCGRVCLVDSGHTIEFHQTVESPHYTGYRTLKQEKQSHGGMTDLLLHAVKDVVRSLQEGTQPRCSGADGVAALEIAAAVVESARYGHPMPVRDRA